MCLTASFSFALCYVPRDFIRLLVHVYKCITYTCSIARIQYVWEYFHLHIFDWQVQSNDYRLTAYATVSFNETSEETTDDREAPDEDRVRNSIQCTWSI